MCNIDDCMLIFPDTLLKISLVSTSLFNCTINSHVCTIMEHLFSIAVLIWTIKHISGWLKNFQLMIINNISLYSMAFLSWLLYSFNKLTLFDIVGILGWSKLRWSDWLIWTFAKKWEKIWRSRELWQPLLTQWNILIEISSYHSMKSYL